MSLFWKAQWLKVVGWIFFLPFSTWPILYLRFVWKIHFPRLRELRAQYRELTKDPRPLLICSNHLTYIDSILLIYAFGHHLFYFRNFRKMTWNLPAAEYAKQPFFWLVCVLNKCLFIRREGNPKRQAMILSTCQELLRRGEPLTIFPEGRRSRTGTFDRRKLALGIGKILSGLDECRVLCVYLRADRQTAASSFPPRDSEFFVETSLLNFSGADCGAKEGQIAAVERIAAVIADMEDRYFAREGSRVPSAR